MYQLDKIDDLIYQTHQQLSDLKKELETDINYSMTHADIVSYIESAEETFSDFEKQIVDVSKEIEENESTPKLYDDEDED